MRLDQKTHKALYHRRHLRNTQAHNGLFQQPVKTQTAIQGQVLLAWLPIELPLRILRQPYRYLKKEPSFRYCNH